MLLATLQRRGAFIDVSNVHQPGKDRNFWRQKIKAISIYLRLHYFSRLLTSSLGVPSFRYLRVGYNSRTLILIYLINLWTSLGFIVIFKKKKFFFLIIIFLFLYFEALFVEFPEMFWVFLSFFFLYWCFEWAAAREW